MDIKIKLNYSIYQGLSKIKVNLPLTTKSKDRVKIARSSNDKPANTTKGIFQMKAIALAALAIPMVTAPALAGPYVMTKSEFKGSDNNYSGMQNQARLGYSTKTGALTPYVELGGGGKTSDGGDTDGFIAAEVGTGIKLTDKLSAKAKFEALSFDTKTDWKVEVGTKYKF
jgi:hypothetical protein